MPFSILRFLFAVQETTDTTNLSAGLVATESFIYEVNWRPSRCLRLEARTADRWSSSLVASSRLFHLQIFSQPAISTHIIITSDSSMSAQEVLASARYGDDEEIRAQLRAAGSPEAQAALVNFAQEDSRNTPLHMGAKSSWRVVWLSKGSL